MVADKPELHFPRAGTYSEFVSGDIALQVSGRCQIRRTECRPTAVGRMGGRVWFRMPGEEEASVPLSYYREYAREQIVPPSDMNGIPHGE